MIKRLYSKRSGFTLVEIIVAFAVFAVFSAMIFKILDMVFVEKTQIAKFAEKTNREEQNLFTISKNEFDTSTGTNAPQTNQLSLAFKKNGVGDDVHTAALKYQMWGSAGEKFDSGLAYFVGYDYPQGTFGGGEGGGEGGGGEGGGGDDKKGGTIMSRMDARIVGSRDFGNITIHYLAPDENYNKAHPGEARYFIEVSADGTSMSSTQIPFAQYKLYFYDASGQPLNILGVDHLDTNASGSGLKTAAVINPSKITINASPSAANNKYFAATSSGHVLRVGTPFQNAGVVYICNDCGRTIDTNSMINGKCPYCTAPYYCTKCGTFYTSASDFDSSKVCNKCSEYECSVCGTTTNQKNQGHSVKGTPVNIRCQTCGAHFATMDDYFNGAKHNQPCYYHNLYCEYQEFPGVVVDAEWKYYQGVSCSGQSKPTITTRSVSANAGKITKITNTQGVRFTNESTSKLAVTFKLNPSGNGYVDTGLNYSGADSSKLAVNAFGERKADAENGVYNARITLSDGETYTGVNIYGAFVKQSGGSSVTS